VDRPGPAAVDGSDWLQVCALGATGYYLSSTLDFVGLQYIAASFERLILYRQPTIVVLLAWAVNRTRPRATHFLGMALSYAGVVLVLGHELRLQGQDVVLGAALVFGSAMTYAVYMVGSVALVRRLGAIRLVGLATSVACVCCIVQFVVLRPVATAWTVAPQVWWLSVVNGTLCTALPVLLLMMVIERIGPSLTAQVGMIGPLATIALSTWLLGEHFTVWIAGDTVLVIAGIFVFSRGRQGSAA
jgi:drug/metabolite transporter (DMT)-like permease